MGIYDRIGNFNGITGDTASELAQARADEKTESIRRPARKVNVMSEEEWMRRDKEWRRRQAKEEEKWARDYRERYSTAAEVVGKILDKYHERLSQERAYQQQIAKKLKAYHEKPSDDTTPPAEWKATYEKAARFLAATVLSYHYQMDQEKGTVRGPDLSKYQQFGFQGDVPLDNSLEAYVQHRNVAISADEESYFERLVAKKVRNHALN
jgi:hypothetical protein